MPPTFRFAVKMTLNVVHARQPSLVKTFCQRVRGLGDHLGPVRVLVQAQRDDSLLNFLLGSLDPALRYAFELRHESWDDPEVDVLLARFGAVRVDELEAAAPFRYLRLREPPYDQGALAVVADRLRPLLQSGIDVYAYFKHEDEPRGPLYAEELVRLTETSS